MRILIITLLLFIFIVNLQSQNCQDDRSLTGLRKGQSYTSPCDSMVVMTKPTYERMRWEEKQKTEIIKSFERSQKLFDQKAIIMDSIILRYKSHTDSLNIYLNEKQLQISKLDSLVSRSTKNTDIAISIARKNQLLAIITGSLTIILLAITIIK